MGELSGDCLRILYNFAYIHLRYMNKNSSLNTNAEKRAAKISKEDPWGCVMARVEGDKQVNRDFTVIKERFATLLGEVEFEPQ